MEEAEEVSEEAEARHGKDDDDEEAEVVVAEAVARSVALEHAARGTIEVATGAAVAAELW